MLEICRSITVALATLITPEWLVISQGFGRAVARVLERDVLVEQPGRREASQADAAPDTERLVGLQEAQHTLPIDASEPC